MTMGEIMAAVFPAWEMRELHLHGYIQGQIDLADPERDDAGPHVPWSRSVQFHRWSAVMSGRSPTV